MHCKLHGIQTLSHTNIKSVCHLSVAEKNIGYRGGILPTKMAHRESSSCAINVLPPINPCDGHMSYVLGLMFIFEHTTCRE